IELRDVIRTSGFVNLRPGGVVANGSLTAADGVPIYIAEPAFAGETALGPFGFVLDAADLANIQDGSAGIVIGGSTHVGQILVSLDFPWLDNLTLQNGGAGSAGISIGAAIGNPGNLVTLSSGGRVAQAAPIAAASLLLHGTQPESSFQLDLPGNSVGTLAARFELPKSLADPSFGDVNFVNAGALAIGPLAGTGFDSAGDLPFAIVAANSTSGGDFFARNLAGNLTLNHGIATLGSDITLVTAGILDNAGGGTLAPAAGGVWRVWADTWVGETRGGLDPGNAQPNFYGCTYPGACASEVTIPAAGNHFIYRQRPTATVVALDAARPFGLPNPPLGFTVTGLVNGDSAADAAAATLSTSATVASPVGTYPITGTSASAVGYVLDFVPATLSVLPNPVPQASTVIEYAQSLLYGRNIGMQNMCLGTGPLLVSAAVDTPDRLDREWSRVRQLPNLTNCVEVGERHGCKDF
ncbi:MAG TPA: MBG domain-containing protein, partial [Rhodocyclaceae bacterium]|nr:MBG domain-containing protein [Rhodocyclaceae bacterium]